MRLQMQNNQTNKNLDNELILAVRNNDLEHLKTLLNSQLFFQQQEYDDAFKEALLYNQEVQEALLQYIDCSDDNILFAIVEDGNSYILEKFLEKKVSYSSENIDLAISLLITQNNDIDEVMMITTTMDKEEGMEETIVR